MTRWIALLTMLVGFTAAQAALGGRHAVGLAVGYALGLVSWVLIEAFFFQRCKLTGDGK